MVSYSEESEDMNDLVKRIQEQRSCEQGFVPDQESVAQIVEQFANFCHIAVISGGDVHTAVGRIVRELANNSLYAQGEQATLQLHIGPKGVIVSYSDTGGFFQQAGIADVLKRHSAGSGGFARIAKAADEIEAVHGVLSCIKYCPLLLRPTGKYAPAGQVSIGARP